MRNILKSTKLATISFVALYFFCLPYLFAQTSSEFKPSGTVWGYAFMDFYWKAQGDTATWASRAEYSGVPKDVYAFSIRRMYLGYDYNISPRFSTTALLEASDVLLSTKGDRTVTIKALNVKWKNFFNRADLIIGQMSTLAFSNFAEKVWNYRSIEKTIVDQRGVRSSSDLGIAIHAKLDSAGNYGYNVMMGNGTATRPEDLTQAGKHKIYSGEVFGYFLDRKLLINPYVDLQTGIDGKNVITLKGFFAYLSDPFTIGVEILSQQFAKVKSDGSDANVVGVSAFARGRIVKDKLTGFVRYDSFNPDNLYRTQDALTVYNPATMFRHYNEQFFVAGLDFTPHKNVHFMPNLWINSYEAKAENDVLVDRKADVVPRLTFYFIFR